METSSPHLGEVLGVLGHATDLAMGQPWGQALASCRLTLRFGADLGWSDDALRIAGQLSLLRYVGCNAETSVLAAVTGNEQNFREHISGADFASLPQVLSALRRSLKQSHPEAGAWHLTRLMAKGVLALPRLGFTFQSHCEIAQRLAARLRLAPDLVVALGQLYERWDGKGQPKGLRGEAIAPATLLVGLCQDALILHRLQGPDSALAVLKQRRGKAYAPELLDRFCAKAERYWTDLDASEATEKAEAFLAGPEDARADWGASLSVLGDFADVKSPHTLGHANRVARRVSDAAEKAELPPEVAQLAVRAAWVHDIGTVAISSAVWDKPSSLNAAEWEMVRLHPYHTERLLSLAPCLRPLAGLAGHHHERLDGRGYHRSDSGSSLDFAARLVAAADVHAALGESRPHRAALNEECAAETLMDEAKAGRLDREAVLAVLAGSGRKVRGTVRAEVGGLTPREIEVLRLLSRGHSIKAMAATLYLAPKTVDNHVQHIYAKIGVSTRAAAALFASEQRLLDPDAA